MAQIQHIAITCQENEKLAEFYKASFGLVEVKRNAPEGREDSVVIYLSDGHINLALLPARPGQPEGINHFGFHVDDLEAARTKALSLGAKPSSNDVPRGGGFVEDFVVDQSGTRVDLSAEGWAT
ncbi:MAG: VOC family protein [Acidimicrobiales bacterium]|nr:VOC family protein [Acidimicrobiales bacterium]MBO0893656.1 VOC family protein [Acidimicrobiales bacterium]